MKNLSQLTADRIALESVVQRFINGSKSGLEATLRQFEIFGDPTPETVAKAWQKHGVEFTKKWYEFLEKEANENPLLLATGESINSFANQPADGIEGSQNFLPQPSVTPADTSEKRKFSIWDVNDILGGLTGVLGQINIATGKKQDNVTPASQDLPNAGVNAPNIPESNFNVQKTLLIAGGILIGLLGIFFLVKKLKK